jgi:hypothetical protein
MQNGRLSRERLANGLSLSSVETLAEMLGGQRVLLHISELNRSGELRPGPGDLQAAVGLHGEAGVTMAAAQGLSSAPSFVFPMDSAVSATGAAGVDPEPTTEERKDDKREAAAAGAAAAGGGGGNMSSSRTKSRSPATTNGTALNLPGKTLAS